MTSASNQTEFSSGRYIPWGIFSSYMRVSTSGVPLGIISHWGSNIATYNGHLPMKELHTVMQPACPGKFPYRPPWQSPGAAPTFRLTTYFVSWYWDSRDFNPKSSTDRPAPIRITPWQYQINNIIIPHKSQKYFQTILDTCYIYIILRNQTNHIKFDQKQAGADITGQLQFQPMVYTLYIGINLTIIMKQYGESEYRAPLSAVPM